MSYKMENQHNRYWQMVFKTYSFFEFTLQILIRNNVSALMLVFFRYSNVLPWLPKSLFTFPNYRRSVLLLNVSCSTII